MGPAPLRPTTRCVWIVQWVRVDGHETRHRIYLREHPARVFLGRLLAAGIEAALFTTPAEWTRKAAGS